MSFIELLYSICSYLAYGPLRKRSITSITNSRITSIAKNTSIIFSPSIAYDMRGLRAPGLPEAITSRFIYSECVCREGKRKNVLRTWHPRFPSSISHTLSPPSLVHLFLKPPISLFHLLPSLCITLLSSNLSLHHYIYIYILPPIPPSLFLSFSTPEGALQQADLIVMPHGKSLLCLNIFNLKRKWPCSPAGVRNNVFLRVYIFLPLSVKPCWA